MPAAGTRVLVVDDSQDHADLMADIFRAGGYDTRVAYNGELALSVLADFKPQCVLLDIHMPSMDGHELAQMLRTYFTDEIMLVGMSGDGEAHPSVAAAMPLMDHHFRKPVDMAALARIFPGLDIQSD